MPYNMRALLSMGAQNLPINNHTLRRISKTFQYSNYDKNKRLTSYFYWLNPEFLNDVLSLDVRTKLLNFDVSSPMLKTLSFLKEDLHPLNKMLYLEEKHFLTDHNLNYTDKMGMAEGIEIRVPLLDPDLVAFAQRLPVNFKQRGRTGKWIFKKAMEGYLPNDVIYRPKTGYSAPLRFWLRNELKNLVDDILSDESIKKRNIFNSIGVKKLRKLDSDGKIDAAYPIFSMVCIEIWCRIFIDGKF
jgi:asparagine synthase (glutamine-hydrolysing)